MRRAATAQCHHGSALVCLVLWYHELRPARHAPYPLQEPAVGSSDADASALLSAAAMRCGGCGSKVAAPLLSRVLARLRATGTPPGGEPVVVGLSEPDDAAVLRPPEAGQLMVRAPGARAAARRAN